MPASAGEGFAMHTIDCYPEADERLRILLTIHTPLSRDLGAPQAIVELAAALVKTGVDVEIFSLDQAQAATDLPAVALPGRMFTRQGSRFALSLGAFIRRNKSTFDVIDANQTDVQALKSELEFEGLLVCRSVGLIRRYHELEIEMARKPESKTSFLRRLANLRSDARMRRAVVEAERSLENADLINVSSQDDAHFLCERGYSSEKVVCFPLGLSAARRESLGSARERRRVRSTKSIVFIGTWNRRKGAADWPTIVARVRAIEPSLRFLFLGVGISAQSVLAQFSENDRAAVRIVERYRFEELPSLLEEADIGAFPGYLEGFGIGVLEMLASGLPVVAYDSPGPRDILRGCGGAELVAPGDVDAFVQGIVRLMARRSEELAGRGAQAFAWSGRFDWDRIANDTVACYEERLGAVRAGG